MPQPALIATALRMQASFEAALRLDLFFFWYPFPCVLGYRTLCSTSLCNCPCFSRRTSSIYSSLPVHLKPPRSYWSGFAFRQVSRGLRRHCAPRWGGVPVTLRVPCNWGFRLDILDYYSLYIRTQASTRKDSNFSAHTFPRAPAEHPSTFPRALSLSR